MPEVQPSPLDFDLLGPVRARLRGVEVDLGAPQQRAVLVMLLLREGAVVTLDELVEGLWGETPPRSAVTTVRTYVCRLRGALSEPGAVAAIRVDSVAGGYILHTSRDAVDVTRFGRHVARGAEAASRGDWATTLAEHGAALRLWRGQPLAGALGPYAEGQRQRLRQLAAAARVDVLRAMIGLGRCGEALPELAAMAADHPFREDIQGLLMTALYGCGRVAEALERYQLVRRALIDELGVEPGIHLRAIHRRVLAADPTLVPAVSAPGTAPVALAGRRPRRSHRPYQTRLSSRRLVA